MQKKSLLAKQDRKYFFYFIHDIMFISSGLGGSTHLRVLQLSHNKISAIGPSDFQGCGNLTELHLQSNRIRSLHPLAFRDLQQLQVKDLFHHVTPDTVDSNRTSNIWWHSHTFTPQYVLWKPVVVLSCLLRFKAELV